jgi:long-chain acyl-CoA synthetase
VKSEIDKLSKELADFEKIKRIALVPHPFTQDSGELTPTLKVKRKVVAEKYGRLLEKGE